jgi:hypothetical protein
VNEDVLVDEVLLVMGGGWGRHGEVLVDEGVAGDGRWVGSTWRCWSTRVLLVMGGGCG